MSGPPDDGSTFLSGVADKGAEAIRADPAFAAAAGDLRAFVLVYDSEGAGMSYAGGHHEDYTWPRSGISAGRGEIRIWLSNDEEQESRPPWRPPPGRF